MADIEIKISAAAPPRKEEEEPQAVANLQNYLSHSVAVGEHPNIITECDKLVKQIAEAEELAKTLNMIIQTVLNLHSY